jgi:hypothetical protein
LEQRIKKIEDNMIEKKKSTQEVNEFPKQLKKLKVIDNNLATIK